MSFPNQKTIIIHQSSQIPFLKIGIEELLNAYKTIKTPSSFVLYLYLASNKDGFELELSQKAFENATDISKSSYHRAVDHLTKLGYIYEDNGHLNFATTPKIGTKGIVQSWEKEEAKLEHPIVKNETAQSQNCNSAYSEMNTEINTINNNKDNKEIDNPSSSDLSYLRKEVDSEGNYDGTSFAEVIPRFDKVTDYFKVKRIAENTRFSSDEANYIVYEILSDNWRTDKKWM